MFRRTDFWSGLYSPVLWLIFFSSIVLQYQFGRMILERIVRELRNFSGCRYGDTTTRFSGPVVGGRN